MALKFHILSFFAIIHKKNKRNQNFDQGLAILMEDGHPLDFRGKFVVKNHIDNRMSLLCQSLILGLLLITFPFIHNFFYQCLETQNLKKLWLVMTKCQHVKYIGLIKMMVGRETI